jgi:hypothetical protein
MRLRGFGRQKSMLSISSLAGSTIAAGAVCRAQLTFRNADADARWWRINDAGQNAACWRDGILKCRFRSGSELGCMVEDAAGYEKGRGRLKRSAAPAPR